VVAVIACSFYSCPGVAGCSDWMIRRGLTRGQVNGILRDDYDMPLLICLELPGKLVCS